MSHHLIHVLTAGSHLCKERGLLRLKHRDSETVRKAPIEDIRAVIIAARGVSITPDLMRELLEQNCVLLHCDHKFKPVGITAGLARTIASDALANQIKTSLKLHGRIWKRVLRAKIRNQAAVVEAIGGNSSYLRRQEEAARPDEASSARHYWSELFNRLWYQGLRRRGDSEHIVNGMLNYGYAVAGALCHRSIVAHGLIPTVGLHHEARYGANPLVYDLMEPIRPFVDTMMCDFVRDETPEEDEDDTMRNWCRNVATGLVERTVSHPQYDMKLLHAIDRYVSSVESCFRNKSIRGIWTPNL